MGQGFITGEEWSKDELKILTENYSKTKTSKLLILLPNRTKKSLYAMADYLGIKKENYKKRVKWNIDSVRGYFADQGCVLLSDEYKTNKISLNYICVCGNESSIAFCHFLKGVRCQRCAGNERFTINQVSEIFEDGGCKLLSKEYINNRQELDYICECGRQDKISLDVFQRGCRCAGCKGDKLREENAHPFEYVYNYFNEQNCELLSISYLNSNEPLDYKCVCGNEAKIRFSDFKNGVRCQECRKKRMSGENHPSWNPNLTEEERLFKRKTTEYYLWAKYVKDRDNYTCQCCGHKSNGDIVSHHLNGYHWAKDERYILENGITLCETCHVDFHNKYGVKWNTKEQFEEYLKMRKEVS